MGKLSCSTLPGERGCPRSRFGFADLRVLRVANCELPLRVWPFWHQY